MSQSKEVALAFNTATQPTSVSRNTGVSAARAYFRWTGRGFVSLRDNITLLDDAGRVSVGEWGLQESEVALTVRRGVLLSLGSTIDAARCFEAYDEGNGNPARESASEERPSSNLRFLFALGSPRIVMASPLIPSIRVVQGEATKPSSAQGDNKVIGQYQPFSSAGLLSPHRPSEDSSSSPVVVPPSPTLSTHSVHFHTSVALREDKHDNGSGMTSLNLLSPRNTSTSGASASRRPSMATSIADMGDEGRSDPAPFHLTPYELANMLDPKNLDTLAEVGGIAGLLRGFGTNNEERVSTSGVPLSGASPTVPNYSPTYNTTSIYHGTVNNVGHIDRATFHGFDDRPEHPSTKCFKSSLAESVLPNIISSKADVKTPPNAFIIFTSGLTKARYSSPSLNMDKKAMTDIVTSTWKNLSPTDRAKIDEDARRAEELHSAMVGSEAKGIGAEAQKQKYWSFADKMVEFWTMKWNEVQAAVNKHIAVLGGGLLGIPSNLTGPAPYVIREDGGQEAPPFDGYHGGSSISDKATSETPQGGSVLRSLLGRLGRNKRGGVHAT
ncbi:hypothetical protein NMY22_g7462 [Coprinellus aureogranulatus]|nr:hypothetical protein NMY22_g7462 [Coprinellus aureogranulatus]